MTDETQSLVVPILRDIQARLGRIEGRMVNLELRMTAQEQHLGAFPTSLAAGQDRFDDLVRRIDRVEKRPEIADPA